MPRGLATRLHRPAVWGPNYEGLVEKPFRGEHPAGPACQTCDPVLIRWAGPPLERRPSCSAPFTKEPSMARRRAVADRGGGNARPIGASAGRHLNLSTAMSTVRTHGTPLARPLG